jgi:hypothetical protein
LGRHKEEGFLHEVHRRFLEEENHRESEEVLFEEARRVV